MGASGFSIASPNDSNKLEKRHVTMNFAFATIDVCCFGGHFSASPFSAMKHFPTGTGGHESLYEHPPLEASLPAHRPFLSWQPSKAATRLYSLNARMTGQPKLTCCRPATYGCAWHGPVVNSPCIGEHVPKNSKYIEGNLPTSFYPPKKLQVPTSTNAKSVEKYPQPTISSETRDFFLHQPQGGQVAKPVFFARLILI